MYTVILAFYSIMFSLLLPHVVSVHFSNTMEFPPRLETVGIHAFPPYTAIYY
jgi:hypothetical protein